MHPFGCISIAVILAVKYRFSRNLFTPDTILYLYGFAAVVKDALAFGDLLKSPAESAATPAKLTAFYGLGR